jgi:hypothetical protein
MLLQSILFWLPMPVIAILNAAIREKILSGFLDELKSHQLSTFLLIIWMSIYCWLVFPYLHIGMKIDAWTTGLIWLTMTVLFEFLAGRYVFNNSWKRLFADYNITSGRLWAVFLVYLAVLPYLIYLIRN